MKELNDSGLVRSFPAGISRGEADREKEYAGDLALLADQLARIADDLRRSTSAARKGASIDSVTSPALDTIAGTIRDEVVRQHIGDDAIIGGHLSSERRAEFARQARQLYANRRRRTEIFANTELFGEPAWDILLDLYVAHSERKSVSVSSACIGSAAPPTTGLRWLGLLAEHDLVMREHDASDQRRVIVRLTEKGLRAMDEFFASAAQ